MMMMTATMMMMMMMMMMMTLQTDASLMGTSSAPRGNLGGQPAAAGEIQQVRLLMLIVIITFIIQPMKRLGILVQGKPQIFTH